MKQELLKLNKKHIGSKGFSVVEILVASAIIGIMVFSLAQVGALSFRLTNNASNRIEAAFLLNEGIEAVRFLRDESWGGNLELLTLDSDYFLVFDGSNYTFQTSAPPLTNEKFQRVLRFSEVLRNGQDDIDQVGTADPRTRKVAIEIEWSDRETALTESVEFYITDLFNN